MKEDQNKNFKFWDFRPYYEQDIDPDDCDLEDSDLDNIETFDATIGVWKDKSWKSPSKLCHKFTVCNQPSPCDVEQGYLDNCYLIALLKSLAKYRPDLIEDLIITKKEHQDGLFEVCLYDHGQKKKFILSDLVPFNVENQCPLGAQKITRNIWPLLLEKAYAIYNQGYDAIQRSSSLIAMSILTQGGAKRIYVKKAYDKNPSSENRQILI
ncbi:unnamed protein product [Moneuplotes crassus]|uniref:Calpain catalytic domain-containing protein n=1 Tax=Euplotes crassus TaxID=5936 RepID=A0AAD1U6G0_EUPCR|nr:unnamed protein product [Moneuplotes crassus]